MCSVFHFVEGNDTCIVNSNGYGQACKPKRSFVNRNGNDRYFCALCFVCRAGTCSFEPSFKKNGAKWVFIIIVYMKDELLLGNLPPSYLPSPLPMFVL